MMTLLTEAYIDGLLKERHNSNALAMALRLSCMNPSIYSQASLIQKLSIASIYHANYTLINIYAKS